MSKRTQMVLAMVITLFGLGGLGLGLMYFFHYDALRATLTISLPELLKASVIGILYGLVALVPLIMLLQTRFEQEVVAFFARLMRDYRVRTSDIWMLSFCAGIGEELLFRGALQPWMGIWLTAILFVFLHGYLNPRNRPLFVYGLILLVVSVGFGYLTALFQIYPAMLAHAVIDVGLLYFLRSRSAQ